MLINTDADISRNMQLKWIDHYVSRLQIHTVHIFNSKVFDLYFSVTIELPELFNHSVNIWERSGWERHKIINIIIGKFHKLISSGYLQWNRENIQILP